jgi:diguanylate cyclase (GGDEF)-like protein/PAS domain S-box-containing protein
MSIGRATGLLRDGGVAADIPHRRLGRDAAARGGGATRSIALNAWRGPLLAAAIALAAVVGMHKLQRRMQRHFESRRAAAQQRALVESGQASVVFENASEGIIVTDADGVILAVNPAFTSITGFDASDAIGKRPGLQHSGRHDAVYYRQIWHSLLTTGQWQGEIWNRRKNGEVYPAWENISSVRDGAGKVTNYVAMLSDITPIKRAEQQLTHLAHHDPLTDLPNRLLFSGHLQQSIDRTRRHGRKVGLLFIDLDRFKRINDSMGHAAGDAVLVEVARRLRSTVRNQDLVARLGGDEFTVVLEDFDQSEVMAAFAQKIIAAVSRPLSIAGREVVVSASVGIAVFPDDGDSTEALTKAADSAMYRAKERGRNTFEFFTREITERAMERLSMESGLRSAIARGELLLLYQPQFDAATRRCVGVEALLRWRHPQEGLLPPDRFIPIAEESDLINAIGQWVLRQACAQARTWLDLGLAPVRVAVNVSGRHVLHDHLVELTRETLAAHDLTACGGVIELEITETMLQSVERSGEVLHALRALGVLIAIDDFGTGYSSLGMLRQLPVDTLKIDKTFIHCLRDQEDSRAIVAAMISMAHALSMRVVAEGVESESELALLCSAGCDEVQGYLLGRPMSAESVTALLQGALVAVGGVTRRGP